MTPWPTTEEMAIKTHFLRHCLLDALGMLGHAIPFCGDHISSIDRVTTVRWLVDCERCIEAYREEKYDAQKNTWEALTDD